MKTYVLYMYRKIDDARNYDDQNIINVDSAPLVGLLDSDDLSEPTRRQKVDMYNLRPFELQQNIIDSSIETLSALNVKILSIDFDYPIDHEVQEELTFAIRKDNFDAIIKLINEVRQEQIDISSIIFTFKSRNFRITKYGVVEIDGKYEELADLTYNSPVALFTGMKNELDKCSN